MRRLGAEDGDDLVGLALHVERLDVVRDRQQVDVRRQLHRRVAPVAGGEDAELAAVDEGLQLVVHRADIGNAVGQSDRRRAELGGAFRIALERRDDVDPVERGEVIEVHDMVVHAVRRDDHVADVLGVERHFEHLSAFSTARTEAMACTVVQTPQIRWVKIQASRGSRSLRMSSMPRHIWPDDQALVTLPSSTSQSMRRCPSMRVMGSMVMRVKAASFQRARGDAPPCSTGNILMKTR